MDPYKLFEYQIWADEELFSYLDNLTENEKQRVFSGYTSIKYRISHITLALEVWYNRIDGTNSGNLPNFMNWDTERIINRWRELNTKFQTFYSKPHGGTFTYTDSKGITHEDNYEDIAFHVVNHTSFYRSQIIMMLGMMDKPVGNLDYINYVRDAAI